MKNLKLLSAIFVLVITLTSCEKDPIDWSTPKANPKIKGEKITPGSNAYVPDTWEIIIENNTLSKIIKLPSFGGGDETNTFNYDADGKIISVEKNTNGNFSEDVFSYNNNKIESIITYNSDNKITLSRYFDYTDPVYITETTNLHDDMENITYTVTYSKKLENGNITNTFDSNNNQVTTYTYDNKKNVFSNLSEINNIVLYYSYTSNRVSVNNKVSKNTTFNYNGNVLNSTNTNYSNVYDEAGRITQSTASGDNETREIFTY